jgi:LemA protein
MAAAGDIKSPEFNNLLASTLSTVKLTVEQYPELKADTQFTALLTELEGSENRIRTAIKDFNDTV